MKRKRRRKITYWIVGLCALAGIWALGDFAYSRIVSRAVDKWEATIERDEDGVQKDARSYTLDGSGTLLVLVHGFNDTPQTFELMAPYLHQQGFGVRTVRMPGFGVPAAQMNSCTCEQWVQSVLSSESIAQQKSPGHNKSEPKYSRVVVVGHSLGGAVAIQAIAESPNSFDAAILLAPAIDVANHRSPVFPTRFWRSLGDRILVNSTIYQSPYDRNDCRNPAWRNPAYKSPFSTRNIVQQTFRLMDQNRSVAERINIPVLMVLSRDDQVTDWSAAEDFFERMRSKNKQLKFYDTSGHALTVDYDWQSVANDIIEFVSTKRAME